ncbi:MULTISPECIES: hypothetical protein [Autumnicola]|uniref:Uncharacterized protein n=2 Tax=Autumnicola TaxID=3160927 RepID=A0ABU3C5M6_9FLAO|nr:MULTISPECIES: hypothetical protein [unclassified Zunongwangia]MDT0641645.1 hypothetical protein [Zunongwangia sp. F363]MDT0678794.1 hypothetical protein [Zunongwangia sp. F117]
MERYYLNTQPQPNGDREVHKESCRYAPGVSNRKDLGFHANCESAVDKAKQSYNQVNGCIHCSPRCHTS